MSADPETPTWPYWLQLGGSAFAGVVVLASGFGSLDAIRQRKTLVFVFALLCAFATSGPFVFGQGWITRGDGFTVHYARWALDIVVCGGFLGTIVYSISPHFVDFMLAMLLGAFGGAATLAASLSDSNGGDDPRTLAWWVSVAGGCNVLALMLMGSIVLNWKRYILFPSAYRDSDGYAMLPSRLVQLVVVFGTAALLASKTLLVALGPEGWRVYESQQNQLWLTMAMSSGAFTLLTLWVFYKINADGATHIEDLAYRIVDAESPASEAMPVNSALPASVPAAASSSSNVHSRQHAGTKAAAAAAPIATALTLY